VRLSSKGQVTIPAPLRQKCHLNAGDEVEIIDDGMTLRIVHDGPTRGRRLAGEMRGKASASMTTDELLGLLRGV
jgi:AbrB family looped-hinge helix DNA binding protein